jgi:hypothetical protein
VLIRKTGSPEEAGTLIMNTIEINPVCELVSHSDPLRLTLALLKHRHNGEPGDFYSGHVGIYDKQPEIHDIRKGGSGN